MWEAKVKSHQNIKYGTLEPALHVSLCQVLATFFVKMANKRGLLGIPENTCETDFVLRVCGRFVRSCSSSVANVKEFFNAKVLKVTRWSR